MDNGEYLCHVFYFWKWVYYYLPLWGVSLHSVPPKINNSSQMLLCRNFTTSEASEQLCQCQTAGDRLRGGIPHTQTHTHWDSHTLRAWETWAQREQLDCTMLLTALFLWGTCQVGFEGKTNASTVPPGLLSTLPKRKLSLSSLSMAAHHSAANTHTHGGKLKIQTGKQAGRLSLQRETEPSENPRDDCPVIFLW